MLPFDLAREFKKRAQTAAPFPRGAVSFRASAVAAANHPRFGALAALGAIGLGGLMMVANLAHERHAAPPVTEAASAPAPKPAESAKPATATPPVKAAEIAPSPPAPATKSSARVDMTATGAIETPPPAKLPPKPHRLKKKAPKSAE